MAWRGDDFVRDHMLQVNKKNLIIYMVILVFFLIQLDIYIFDV